MSAHPNRNPLILRIWQQNLNKSLLAQLDALSSIESYDILAFQEPHIDFLGNSRANSHFTPIYPSNHNNTGNNKTKTRSLILINKRLSSDAWTRIDLDSSDVTAVQIKGEHINISIFNIYNDCKHNNSLKVVKKHMREQARTLQNPTAPQHFVWLGDFNRHSPLWDEPRNEHLFTAANLDAAQELLDMAAQYDMHMALPVYHWLHRQARNQHCDHTLVPLRTSD
jgi:hypothetical protein